MEAALGWLLSPRALDLWPLASPVTRSEVQGRSRWSPEVPDSRARVRLKPRFTRSFVSPCQHLSKHAPSLRPPVPPATSQPEHPGIADDQALDHHDVSVLHQRADTLLEAFQRPASGRAPARVSRCPRYSTSPSVARTGAAGSLSVSRRSRASHPAIAAYVRSSARRSSLISTKSSMYR